MSILYILFETSSMIKNIPLLFLTVCIPLRIGLIVGAYFIEQPDADVAKEPFVALIIIMSLGFLSSNINSQVLKRGSDVRGFAGSVKYWNSLAHATLFALYAFFLSHETKYSYVILIADLVFGLITVLEHYL